MTQRTIIPDEVKAAALADLILLAPATVAAKYGIKPSTVRQWKRRELAELAPLSVTGVTVKKERIGALALEYLEANFNAQIAQAYVTSDPTYINRQPAGELAILHGVLADKSIRLLEALHGRQDEQQAMDTD